MFITYSAYVVFPGSVVYLSCGIYIFCIVRSPAIRVKTLPVTKNVMHTYVNLHMPSQLVTFYYVLARDSFMDVVYVTMYDYTGKVRC